MPNLFMDSPLLSNDDIVLNPDLHPSTATCLTHISDFAMSMWNQITVLDSGHEDIAKMELASLAKVDEAKNQLEEVEHLLLEYKEIHEKIRSTTDKVEKESLVTAEKEKSTAITSAISSIGELAIKPAKDTE